MQQLPNLAGTSRQDFVADKERAVEIRNRGIPRPFEILPNFRRIKTKEHPNSEPAKAKSIGRE